MSAPSDFQRSAIRQVVSAHHQRGTRRAEVLRALTDLAADHLASEIERAVEEVYDHNWT